MRKILAVAVLAGAAGLAASQEPAAVPPRYGVPPNPDTYPQATPKDALASAVRAAERGRVEYLAAHLIDPRVIDARVADRARQLEPAADRDLRAARQAQRAHPVALTREERLPDDPARFAEAVRAEAARRAFRLVARDVAAALAENPDHLRQLQRFLRAGTFVDAGETSSVTLPDVKGLAVSFRKVGDLWYVEDRRQPADTPAAPAPAPEKK